MATSRRSPSATSASPAPYLRPAETELLHFSGHLLVYENGVRFLTGYLNGDVYFKIHRDRHNLDRCRAQFKLPQSFQTVESRMRRIVAEAMRAGC